MLGWILHAEIGISMVFVKQALCLQVSNAPILGGPAPPQHPPAAPEALPTPQQQPQQQQQPLTQSAFAGSGRFDSFGSQFDDFSGPGQSGRLQPSASLGPAPSIPEGAPVFFEGEFPWGCMSEAARLIAFVVLGSMLNPTRSLLSCIASVTYL